LLALCSLQLKPIQMLISLETTREFIKFASSHRMQVVSHLSAQVFRSVQTNYHVVSDFIHAPEDYEIKYVTHDGEKGVLELLDFDVISDLAILRHPSPSQDYFSLNPKELQKGERAYALGNPGDWGIIMVPGPTNGFVEHNYEDRVLFSGSLNPGMSGGPSLNAGGEVVGVNVATAGSQLSFLVPAKKAVALLNRKTKLEVESYQDEIAEQIKQWQRPRMNGLLSKQWDSEEFSGRSLFGELRSDFQCWGGTNEHNKDRVIASVDKHCHAGDDVYLSNNLNAGQVSFSFQDIKTIKLNASQFARMQSTQMSADNSSDFDYSTNYLCESDFINSFENNENLGLKTNNEGKGYKRVVTCVRAYKKLQGLYDSLLIMQHHQNNESFTAHLSLSALEKDQIKLLNKRFIKEVL